MNESDIQFAYDIDHAALVYRGPAGRPVAFPVAALRRFWPNVTSEGLQKSLPNIGSGPRIVSPGMSDFAALRAAKRNGR